MIRTKGCVYVRVSGRTANPNPAGGRNIGPKATTETARLSHRVVVRGKLPYNPVCLGQVWGSPEASRPQSTMDATVGDSVSACATYSRACRIPARGVGPPRHRRTASGGLPFTVKASLATTPMPVMRRWPIKAERVHPSGIGIQRLKLSGSALKLAAGRSPPRGLGAPPPPS